MLNMALVRQIHAVLTHSVARRSAAQGQSLPTGRQAEHTLGFRLGSRRVDLARLSPSVSRDRIKRGHHGRQAVCEAQPQNDGICSLYFPASLGKTKVIRPNRTSRFSVSHIPTLSIDIHGRTLRVSPSIRFS
jgi:hypothetical protein